MKVDGGVELQYDAFLTSAQYGGERSPSCPNFFTPGEMTPSTHWIGSWLGHRAGLEL